MAKGITISDTAKLQGIIHLLGILITIGKYLPLIVVAFATINLWLGAMGLLFWDRITFGVFNIVLSVGGFVFLGQLLKRRKVRRNDFTQAGRRRDSQTVKDESPRKTSVPASA